jgi:hypothetical protein
VRPGDEGITQRNARSGTVFDPTGIGDAVGGREIRATIRKDPLDSQGAPRLY